jgi:hypothetical protein
MSKCNITASFNGVGRIRLRTMEEEYTRDSYSWQLSVDELMDSASIVDALSNDFHTH